MTKNVYYNTSKTRLVVWILMEMSEFAVELHKTEEKDNVMENLYVLFQIREAVSCLEVFQNRCS